ncbi:MAG: hypothetical protein E7576_07995 [Ruminococcaceae bacterium]|nr:hypothetical protein [Oscillospiraceae bacterium]
MKCRVENPKPLKVKRVLSGREKAKRVLITAAAVGASAGVLGIGAWVARNTHLRPAEESTEVAQSKAAAAFGPCSLSDLPAYEADLKPRLEFYAEGDSPIPAWYNPDEPMAVVWDGSAGTDHIAESNKMVGDFVPDIFVGDTDVLCNAEPHPPVGIDCGGIDYNIEPEVVPDYLLDIPLDRYLQEYIYNLCEDSGLPYTLAIAVIEQESTYTPWVVSESNDYGLMQINTVCHDWLARELGINDFLSPYQNVLAGIYILSGYYEELGWESGTLMAYNMGEAGARALFEQGIYSTDYSERVLGIKYRLDTEGR